jgi:hypothetical protein
MEIIEYATLTTKFVSAEQLNKFIEFYQHHRENPLFWDLFVKYAKEAKTAGRTKLGAGVIGERLRWYIDFEVKDWSSGDFNESFKVNTKFLQWYSRLFDQTYSDGGIELFTKRRSPADGLDLMKLLVMSLPEVMNCLEMK